MVRQIRKLPAESRFNISAEDIKNVIPEVAIADAVANKTKKKRSNNSGDGQVSKKAKEKRSNNSGDGQVSKRKRIRTTIVTLIIIAILVGGGFIFTTFTPGGQAFSAALGISGTQLKDVFQKDTAEINIVKQALTGQYDFSQTWRSDTQKTKYEGKDVGVVLTNVRPIKDIISISPGETTDDIVIVGSLKIVSVPVTIRDAKDAKPNVTALVTSIFDNETEICATILQTKEYSNRFTCEHSGITHDILKGKTTVSKEVKVTLDYSFETLSGKTLYAIKNDEYNRLILDDIDILQHFEIKQRRSWQTTSPVGLGIGLSGESDTFPANSNDNTVAHFLGITIENKGSGTLTAIKSITLEVPTDLIYVKDGNDFSVKLKNNLRDCSSATNTCKYELKDLDVEPLEPGFKENVFFKFKFPEDKLEGKEFEELFLLADVEFYYTQDKFSSITIKER